MNLSIHLVTASPPRGEMLKPWEQTRTGTPCKPQVEPLELTLCKPEAGSHPEGVGCKAKADEATGRALHFKAGAI